MLLGVVALVLSGPAAGLHARVEQALAPGDDLAGMFSGGIIALTILLSPLIGSSAGAVHAFVVNRRFASRERRNLCARCGYDRRASPVRCPECGMAVSVSRLAGDADAAANGSGLRP